jgi:hypothetical protein
MQGVKTNGTLLVCGEGLVQLRLDDTLTSIVYQAAAGSPLMADVNPNGNMYATLFSGLNF